MENERAGKGREGKKDDGGEKMAGEGKGPPRLRLPGNLFLPQSAPDHMLLHLT